MNWKRDFEFRITCIYLILGIIWILTSDFLVKFLAPDINKVSQFQSFKGVVFVLLSACVIYLLARHYRNKQQVIKKRLIKARKKAENNERLKSAFLANLSHEVRTPMNGILGFVSLLEDPDFQKEEHSSYLKYVKMSSERMLMTLNDIIEISHIESNLMEVQITEFNLRELLSQLYELYLPAANDKQLNFELDIQLSDDKLLVSTDRYKLESILKNFVKNALKFSSAGTIVLGAKASKSELEFFVKDNGIGIPSRLQKKIFDRFVQGDSTITRSYEGSGLGLAIAKAYAGLLGGTIGLESEEDKGSTFWLKLPDSLIVKPV